MIQKSMIFTLVSIFVASANAQTMIDLNDFFADPTVTISPDGSMATMAEDAGFSVVLLTNDPGLGDPNVIIAGGGKTLMFDYMFTEGVGDDDEFGAFVLNSLGVSAGPAFEFFTDTTSSGSVSFDLSGLTGEPYIGLQFQLTSNFGDVDLDSIVKISNVKISSGVVGIPEPSGSGISLLFVGTLVGLVRCFRPTV